MDELLKWREEFPILTNTTYMISNSLGAMPRAVQARLRDYATMWATRGVRAWEEGWWEMAVGVGDQVAALLGARPGEISLHQNVTLTQAVITSCFNFRGPRNKVVLVPHNPHMEPMVFEPGDVTIFGRVVTVLRSL